MRVLIVDEEIPFPPNSGKRLRTFNLIKNLAPRHEIVWVSRGLQNISFDSRIFEELGISCISAGTPVLQKSGPRFCAALLANLFSRYPYVVTSHRSAALTEVIRRTLERKRFDLIHCEWTPYAFNLQGLCGVPKIVMAHNVESRVWERSYLSESNPMLKAFIYLQWKKMEGFERKFLQDFSRVVAVSEEDASLLARWVPPNCIAVVPNGVDVDYFRPSDFPEASDSIVFTGSLDWRANVDCLLYFLKEMWPLIKRAIPNCRFTVVGRNPNSDLRLLLEREEGVSLEASVEDVRPFLARASVAVVPLRIGSGSRLKIIEAMAMKKPVVSTKIGAEGFEFESGKHLILADNPVQFASAVTGLLRNPMLRKALGSEGCALVQTCYRWDTIAKRLEKVWQEAVCN